MANKGYLLLLITAISPILSGLAFGKTLILAYIIVFIMLFFLSYYFLKQKTKHFIYTQISIILLVSSGLDALINVYRGSNISKETLFTETTIPLVYKYKPNSKLSQNYYDCSETLSKKTNCDNGLIIDIAIDSLGFRNNKHVFSGCEILLVGDSFGVGYAPQDSIISEVLYTKHQFNTYNLSVSGNGPWEQYHTTRSEIEKIPVKEKFTVYWLLFSGNDLEGNFGPIYDLDSLNFTSKKLSRYRDSYYTFRKSSPIRIALENLCYNSQSEKLFVKKTNSFTDIVFYNEYVDELKHTNCCECSIENHVNFLTFKNTVTAFITFLKKRNIDLKILLVPSKEEVYQWILNDKKPWTSPSCSSPLSKTIEHLSKMQEVQFYDLKPYLIEKSKDYFLKNNQLLYWKKDTHLNNVGNRLIAEFIANIETTSYSKNTNQ
ncbi:MAG: alginate O-acetyltransferase AlgX-related protein [Bacteroidia bacterium]